jgi:hypothetical protein
MNEREQIITFLLQQCDQKNAVIEQLRNQLALLQAAAQKAAPPAVQE